MRIATICLLSIMFTGCGDAKSKFASLVDTEEGRLLDMCNKLSTADLEVKIGNVSYDIVTSDSVVNTHEGEMYYTISLERVGEMKEISEALGTGSSGTHKATVFYLYKENKWVFSGFTATDSGNLDLCMTGYDVAEGVGY